MSGDDLVPLATISQDGLYAAGSSYATIGGETNRPVVSRGPNFEYFQRQAG